MTCIIKRGKNDWVEIPAIHSDTIVDAGDGGFQNSKKHLLIPIRFRNYRLTANARSLYMALCEAVRNDSNNTKEDWDHLAALAGCTKQEICDALKELKSNLFVYYVEFMGDESPIFVFSDTRECQDYINHFDRKDNSFFSEESFMEYEVDRPHWGNIYADKENE